MRVASYMREGCSETDEKMILETHRAEVKNETKKDGRLGGLSSPGLDGCPDRWIVPRWNVELWSNPKHRGKIRPTSGKRESGHSEELGFLVFCVDSKEMIGGVLHDTTYEYQSYASRFILEHP